MELNCAEILRHESNLVIFWNLKRHQTLKVRTYSAAAPNKYQFSSLNHGDWSSTIKRDQTNGFNWSKLLKIYVF